MAIQRYIIDVRVHGDEICKRIIVETDQEGKVAIVNKKSFETLTGLINYYRTYCIKANLECIKANLECSKANA